MDENRPLRFGSVANDRCRIRSTEPPHLNAITSGNFADQTYSKSTANEAGETSAVSGGFSGGTRQNRFIAQFDIASTVPGAQQAGLAMSVAPDRGDGGRMSYLRFEDQADGIHVIFDDYRDVAPFGTATGDDANGCGVGDDFTDIDIATISRTARTRSGLRSTLLTARGTTLYASMLTAC